MYYCVLRLADGVAVYKGQSIGQTAQAMEPGTVYGAGHYPSQAEEAAMVQFRKFAAAAPLVIHSAEHFTALVDAEMRDE